MSEKRKRAGMARVRMRSHAGPAAASPRAAPAKTSRTRMSKAANGPSRATPSSPSSGGLVLGIDLGTSAVKVVALGADSTILASGSASFATVSESTDQAEQNPADWLEAARAALAQAAPTLDESHRNWRTEVVGIGVTGQLPTLVCLGSKGRPLGRAITWKDARADRTAAEVLDHVQRRALYERTGMPVDGRYLGPMFRHHWLKKSRDVAAILSAKDYLVRALTGAHVTDPSTAAGYAAFDLSTGEFARDLCKLWQMPLRALPSVAAAHSKAGQLTRSSARLLGLSVGVPVSVGAADSVSSAYALGGMQEGVACITMGSSTIIMDAVRAPRFDSSTRYLLTPHAEPGWYGREMDLLATGTGHSWLSGLLGLQEGMLDARAARSPPGSRGLTFSPYLAGGEQGALWNPMLRGAIHGLTVQHDQCDLARAFLEGVGFEIRRCLDVLTETAPITEVVLSGHLAGHPSSLQMLADILERPIHPVPPGSPAALGAALGALQMVTSQKQRGRRDRSWPSRIVPSADAAPYRELYRQYLTKTLTQMASDANTVV